jgi:hypothetical protein
MKVTESVDTCGALTCSLDLLIQDLVASKSPNITLLLIHDGRRSDSNKDRGLTTWGLLAPRGGKTFKGET